MNMPITNAKKIVQVAHCLTEESEYSYSFYAKAHVILDVLIRR